MTFKEDFPDQWCPRCGHKEVTYRRTISVDQCRSMIAMYIAGGSEDFVHIPSVSSRRSREEGRLRFWGLIKAQGEARDDGGPNGKWMITNKGVAFMLGRITVHKTAVVRANKLIEFQGEQVTFQQCLGHYFDLRDVKGDDEAPDEGD